MALFPLTVTPLPPSLSLSLLLFRGWGRREVKLIGFCSVLTISPIKCYSVLEKWVTTNRCLPVSSPSSLSLSTEPFPLRLCSALRIVSFINAAWFDGDVMRRRTMHYHVHGGPPRVSAPGFFWPPIHRSGKTANSISHLTDQPSVPALGILGPTLCW